MATAGVPRGTSASSPQQQLFNDEEKLEKEYLELCATYHSSIDAGAIICLRERLDIYSPSIPLKDIDLLPICSIFKTQLQLRVLNLGGCKIGCNGAYIIYNLLKWNSEIEEIDLSNNQISDLGAKALGKILLIPKSKLRALSLHWNRCVSLSLTPCPPVPSLSSFFLSSTRGVPSGVMRVRPHGSTPHSHNTE